MATNEQLAAFAFNAYRPLDVNALLLTGWTRDVQLSNPNRGAGFDGSVFYTGSACAPTEIVIALRGTDAFLNVDWPLGNQLQ